jgi:hypothetical protein
MVHLPVHAGLKISTEITMGTQGNAWGTQTAASGAFRFAGHGWPNGHGRGPPGPPYHGSQVSVGRICRDWDPTRAAWLPGPSFT